MNHPEKSEEGTNEREYGTEGGSLSTLLQHQHQGSTRTLEALTSAYHFSQCRKHDGTNPIIYFYYGNTCSQKIMDYGPAKNGDWNAIQPIRRSVHWSCTYWHIVKNIENVSTGGDLSDMKPSYKVDEICLDFDFAN